jgi:hypothetical protein
VNRSRGRFVVDSMHVDRHRPRPETRVDLSHEFHHRRPRSWAARKMLCVPTAPILAGTHIDPRIPFEFRSRD